MSMIDYDDETEYNEEVKELVSMIGDIRHTLDKMEVKFYELLGNNGSVG